MLVVCVALCAVSPAHAHLGSTKHLDVTIEGGRVAIAVWIEVVDARALLDLAPEGPSDDVLARRARLGERLLRGITARGASPCALSLRSVTRAERDGRRYVRASLDGPCDVQDVLAISDTTIFPEDRQHEAFVRRGDEVVILRRGRQTATLRVRVDPMSTIGRMCISGAMHFATGYDHVLFLVTLLLPYGRLAEKRGRRRALVEVAWVVTAFTIGHSVTLALATFSVLVLPSKLVEALIALSIVIVAVFRVARPTSHAATPWLALAFGLLHGLGFASVLSIGGLSGTGRAAALVAFNVGIELAQLAFVAALLPLLVVAARHDGYVRVVVRGGGVVIAALGLLWLLERLA